MRVVVRSGFIASMAILLVVGAPRQVRAQAELEEEARIHFMAGRAHYEKGAFLEAATEFEAAYRVSGYPKLLYNVYLAYRDGDAKEQAARALREYLEKESVIENRQQLEARLKVLESHQGDGPAATPPPAEPSPAPAPVAATATAAPADEGGSLVLPIVLMGVGGALALASIPMFVISGSAGSDVEKLCPDTVCSTDEDLKDVQDLSAKENTFQALSYTFLFSGIAVAGTGLVLLLLNPGGSSEEAPPVALGCSANGCYGSMHLQF